MKLIIKFRKPAAYEDKAFLFISDGHNRLIEESRSFSRQQAKKLIDILQEYIDAGNIGQRPFQERTLDL